MWGRVKMERVGAVFNRTFSEIRAVFNRTFAEIRAVENRTYLKGQVILCQK